MQFLQAKQPSPMMIANMQHAKRVENVAWMKEYFATKYIVLFRAKVFSFHRAIALVSHANIGDKCDEYYRITFTWGFWLL